MRVSINEDKIEIEKKIRNAERTIGCIIIELEKNQTEKSERLCGIGIVGGRFLKPFVKTN